MCDVTVLMTVYNGMPYLPRAVESVLGQTLRELRLVVVNDGSTDGSANYLATLNDEHVLVLHQTNLGTAAAANYGLQYCETEFVARMDADDIMLPTRLEAQRDFLRAHRDVGLVGTQAAPLGELGQGKSLQLPRNHQAITAALTAGHHALAHSSIMFRTAIAREIGGYWSLPLVDDWDFMLRMGEAAPLANLNDVLHLYRVHPGSLNGSAMRCMRFSIDYACELARRRRSNLPPITAEQHETQRAAQPLWRRAARNLEQYALSQYRIAVADVYGGRPVWGRARLAWAAACAPGLTLRRIGRNLRPARPSGQTQDFTTSGAPIDLKSGLTT